MMEYSVSFSNVTITTPGTGAQLVFINPGAAPLPNIEIIRAWAGQASTATSAQLNISHSTQVSVFPTVTGATPAKLKRSSPVSNIVTGTAGAAGTAGTAASVTGAGAQTVIFGDAFNNLNGYLWVATPKETIIMPAGSTSGYGLYLITVPSALGNWSAGANYGEV